MCIRDSRLGSKAIEMVYAASAGDAHNKATLTREVDAARRERFCLSEEQVESLARQAMIIEKHYQRPMDIEWALDGGDGKLYIVQARPEPSKTALIPPLSNATNSKKKALWLPKAALSVKKSVKAQPASS